MSYVSCLFFGSVFVESVGIESAVIVWSWILEFLRQSFFLAPIFFTYWIIMTRRSPVGKIVYPSNIVKYVESPLPGSLWAVASSGYSWVHPYGVITTSPYSSPLYVITTLQNSEGDILVTFSLSVNYSGFLVVLYDGCLGHCFVQTLSTTLDGVCWNQCVKYVIWVEEVWGIGGYVPGNILGQKTQDVVSIK